MQVEYRSTNGGDWLILVNNNKVLAHWPVKQEDLKNFISPSDPADWAATPQVYVAPDGYGELVAIKTADGVEAVDINKYVERVKFFGLPARHLGDIGVNPDKFTGVLYAVFFDIGNRPGSVMRSDYLGWEEALAGLIDDLPDSDHELSSVHNCAACETEWKDGQGKGIKSRSVNPLTRDWA